jgi:hypothetical protein
MVPEASIAARKFLEYLLRTRKLLAAPFGTRKELLYGPSIDFNLLLLHGFSQRPDLSSFLDTQEVQGAIDN